MRSSPVLLLAVLLAACAQHRPPAANRQLVLVEDPRAKAIAEYNAKLPKSAWTQEWDHEVPSEVGPIEFSDPALQALWRDYQALAHVSPPASYFETESFANPAPQFIPAARSGAILPRSYTMRNNFGGGYTIENDLDPMDSHTVRPRFDGGYTIENDFNPLDSVEVRRVGF